MIPRGARGPTYMQCRCCSEGVEESVRHVLFECECHRGIRDDFVAQIRRKDPWFGMASDEQRTHVLLSDDTPEEFDNFLYRYLKYFSLRLAKRGWNLWPPGVGLRVTAVL